VWESFKILGRNFGTLRSTNTYNSCSTCIPILFVFSATTCEKERDDLGDGNLDLEAKKRKTNEPLAAVTIKMSVQQEAQPEEKRPDQRSPLERYRGGYLWVTDLVNQIWCEQQMFYKLTMPAIVKESPIITAGQHLHLARGSYTLFIYLTQIEYIPAASPPPPPHTHTRPPAPKDAAFQFSRGRGVSLERQRG
jgi:hypothetical protein